MLDFLAARRLTDPVKKRVPEHTRRYMDRPPPSDRWLGSYSIDDVFEAVHDLGGPPLNLQMGRHVARQLTDGRLRPVVASIFAVLGRSPAALFRSLDVCTSLALRGVSFTYETTDTERFVVAHYRGSHVPEGSHHAVRGALLHVFELSGAPGEVGEPKVQEAAGDEVRVRYAVRY